MNIQDRKKTLTVEDLRRRYNLDALDKDRKAIQLVKNTINKTEIEFQKYILAINSSLEEYPNQADGNITAWFFDGIPTEEQPLFTNKENHLGDLYYDRENGLSYKYVINNDEYTWKEITNSSIKESLALASDSPDTADNKRITFIIEPQTPYNIGDIWINNGIYYRCRASREAGTYNILDWLKSTEYTDDLVALQTKAELDQFKTTVTENYVTNATLETTTNSITGRVEETYTYVTTVENEVNGLTKSVEETINNVAQLEIKVDGITAEVSHKYDFLESDEGVNQLDFDNSLEYQPVSFNVKGYTEHFEYLFPLEAKLKELHIEGKCVQDGEPTPDAPVEIKTIPSIVDETGAWAKVKVTGKNLLSLPNDSVTSQGLTTICENGILQVNGTATTNWADITNRIYKNISIGTYLLSINDIKDYNITIRFYYEDGTYNNYYISAGSQSIKINITKKVVQYYLYIWELTQEQSYADNILVQLEEITDENQEPTEYEAYKEKEVLIDLSKPNLFDTVFEKGNVNSVDGTVDHTYDVYSKVTTNLIKVEPNTTYTFDCSGNENIDRMAYFDRDGTFISRSDRLSVKTFTTIDNCYYIRFNVWNDTSSDNINVDNSKVYEGYTDYYELSSIGDTKDTLDIVDGQVVIDKKIDKAVLDGDEDFGMNYGTGMFHISSLIKYSSTNRTGKSNYFTYNNINSGMYDGLKDGEFALQYSNNMCILFMKILSCLTVDELKTWLSENNTEVYYILAESQQIILPNTNIPLFDGVNHITLVDDLETTITAVYNNLSNIETSLSGTNTVMITDCIERNLYPSDDLYPLGIIEGSCN